LRELGRLDEADRLLDEASARFPGNDPITLARAWLANALHDWPLALRRWDDIRTLHPDHPSGYIGGAHALRVAGRHEQAQRLLEDAMGRFPENDKIIVERARLANARRDWPAALRCWDDIRARDPGNLSAYLGGATALRELGRLDEADALLDAAAVPLLAAKQRGTDGATTARLEFDIALARRDWPQVRRSAEAMIAGHATPPARLCLDLARACWHLGDRPAADNAAQRALAVHPAFADAILLRAMVATDLGDGEAALSCYRRLTELEPGTARWSLKVVQLLNWFGHVDEAVAELDKLNRQWPDDPMVRTFVRHYGPAAALPLGPATARGRLRGPDPDHATEAELQALADKAPDLAEHRRPVLAIDPKRDVLVAQVGGSEVGVLVFTGSNDAVSMPLALFDQYLAPLAITAIYLKDFNRLRFLRGIRSMGADYQTTLVALRELLAGLGVRRLCTLGNCDGGFAAIRYGVELGADRIIAFHAPTHSPPETLAKVEQARNFMRRRLAAMVPADMSDLRQFLQACPHDARIELFYDETEPRDTLHAMYLSDLPGIRLHPRPGNSMHHLLLGLALTSDDFTGVLGTLFGIERGAA
jgi:tetratricopeptide (TPR) repeat protein